VLPQCRLLPQFVNAELVLRASHLGFRVTEVPVTHYQREEGGSRGLPLRRLPAEIAALVRGLVELRRELGAAARSESRP
jgi:hypothetical protein